ncbi:MULTISPECIES: hypothetical protein [Pseudomonadaceae]|uniref:hypothetical protein n=1 Tax=Pseudomonadaceae TaxID=135621 RepID=UPI00135849B3|nr:MULTISPECIES: hypothetical protein [Pseudomonas]MCP1617209.1 hypothetical protein [Pseudomonas otitidis]
MKAFYVFNYLILKIKIEKTFRSIIGATEKRRDSAGRVVTGVELDSRGIWGRLISARFTPFPMVVGPRSLQVASQIRRVANREMGTITHGNGKTAVWVAPLRSVSGAKGAQFIKNPESSIESSFLEQASRRESAIRALSR